MASSSSVKEGCLSSVISHSSLEGVFSLPDQTTKSTAKTAPSLHVKAPGPNAKLPFWVHLAITHTVIDLASYPEMSILRMIFASCPTMNVCKLRHSIALAYSTLVVAKRRSAMPTYLWNSVVYQLVDLRHNQIITSALATLLDHANISSFSSAFIIRLPRQPVISKGILCKVLTGSLMIQKCKRVTHSFHWQRRCNTCKQIIGI